MEPPNLVRSGVSAGGQTGVFACPSGTKIHRRPGPKWPTKELIDAIVEFKRRNPRVGYPRIAQEIARAFGIDIDKDIVRRVLAKHYRPEAGTDGPSWLSHRAI
jgi:putative transposase